MQYPAKGIIEDSFDMDEPRTLGETELLLTNGNSSYGGVIESSSGTLNADNPSQDRSRPCPVSREFSGWPERRSWFRAETKELIEFLTSSKVKMVLKCSVAYAVASLAVYYPSVRRLYGRTDNKHMIATVTVYFHPARTMGSMAEAIFYASMTLMYSFICAVLSMVISAVFYDLNRRYLGYMIDLVLFLGFGLGIIAFMKQRMNKPNFNTACSIACIFLVVILTKEGNVQAGRLSISQLLQSFSFVISGATISVIVSYVLWPQTAISNLKESLNKALDIHSEMLTFVSRRFVRGETIETPEFDDLTSQGLACYNSIEKNLADSWYELHLGGAEKEYKILHRMVESLSQLSILLRGLCSSAKIQWHLLSQEVESSSGDSETNSIASIEDVISPASTSSRPASIVHSTEDPSEDLKPSSPAELFQLFVYHLGPPMRSYYLALKTILDNIPFTDGPHYEVSLQKGHRASLRMASDLYISARQAAIAQLYSQDVFKSNNLTIDAASDEEGIAASCGNFSYVLEEFGTELGVFMDYLEEYELQSQSKERSYEWLKFWRKDSANGSSSGSGQHCQLFRNLNNILYNSGFASPQNTGKPSFGLQLWRNLRMFRRTDVQFGIKFGIGALIFAIPAFLDNLRPIYSRWRGEWGLITYAIVMSKSVGGTTMTIPIRLVGTFIGAMIAYLSWTAFPENQYILAFIGWVMSLVCFWIILHWKTKNPFGRFILLTFNLTALYSYSLTVADDENDDDEGGINPIVGEIAFHRFVSVSIGVLWAVFIATAILPNSARKMVRPVLCIQWLRMGLIWKSDVLKPKLAQSATEESTGMVLSGVSGEHELQRTMVELAALLKEAPNELRLKGPFPVDDYKEILSSTQKILDAFHNITVLVNKDPRPSSGELSMIEYTEPERRELCSRIFMFFYLTAAAIKLGFPLPDKLPSTEHAIDRMLAKLNEYRIRRIVKEDVEYEDFVLFYSYILVTITITEELAKIALRIQTLFGTIEDEAFEIN